MTKRLWARSVRGAAILCLSAYMAVALAQDQGQEAGRPGSGTGTGIDTPDSFQGTVWPSSADQNARLGGLQLVKLTDKTNVTATYLNIVGAGPIVENHLDTHNCFCDSCNLMKASFWSRPLPSALVDGMGTQVKDAHKIGILLGIGISGCPHSKLSMINTVDRVTTTAGTWQDIRNPRFDNFSTWPISRSFGLPGPVDDTNGRVYSDFPGQLFPDNHVMPESFKLGNLRPHGVLSAAAGTAYTHRDQFVGFLFCDCPLGPPVYTLPDGTPFPDTTPAGNLCVVLKYDVVVHITLPAKDAPLSSATGTATIEGFKMNCWEGLDIFEQAALLSILKTALTNSAGPNAGIGEAEYTPVTP